VRSALLVVACGVTIIATGRAQGPAAGGADARETPTLHHIHLNSPNPAAAIDGYLKSYPTNTRAQALGLDGFKTSNGVVMLFTKVSTPSPVIGPDRPGAPQTAFWHHVWNVPDVRNALPTFREGIPGFRLIPQYLDPEGTTGEFSSDGLTGFLTSSQVAESKRQGGVPSRRGGYFNWYGPDGVVMETLQGATETYTIFGMFQEQPVCALLWYERHLNATVPGGRGGSPTAGRTPENCAVQRGEVSWPSTYRQGHVRVPPAMAVTFSDVSFRWYMNQSNQPLVSTRGHIVDHFALSVRNVDAWAARLRRDGVRILEEPRIVGGARVVMIEGPSREAIELVQANEAGREVQR
jgi:hypothetical protein